MCTDCKTLRGKFLFYSFGRRSGNDDEGAFIALFGGVEVGYLIVKGQNWVLGYVDSIHGNFGNPSTNI